jgi:rare lipoprotein A
MTDITHHEIADDGFHEIQLSGKQLVFLFMATTIVAVVIFLCGVQVGRNVRTVRVADAGDSAAATPSPATSSATPQASGAAAAPPAVDPPSPAQEAEDDLSYANRLQSDKAPKEQLKPKDEPAPAPPTPAPVASAPAKSAPAKSTPPPAAAQSSTASANPPTARSGAWVIQVNALTNRAAADAMARRLSGKGYPAFVLAPASGAPVVYRVQVGRYSDRREAEQVARRLEKEEQLKPWVQH